LRENEKESKIKQKRNYDRRHRARLLTKVKTNDKVWIKDQKKSGTAFVYHSNGQWWDTQKPASFS
jgi:hypothetical protein